MVNGFRSEEYRSRSRTIPTNGLVLLHAGSSKQSDHVIDQYNIPHDQIVRGAILGAAIVTQPIYSAADECYIYGIEQAIAFPEPYFCKGQLPIFWKPTTPEQYKAFTRLYPFRGLEKLCRRIG